MTALKPQATDYLALEEIRPHHAEVSQNLERRREEPINLEDPQYYEENFPFSQPKTLYEIAKASLPGTPAEQDALEARYVRRTTEGRGDQRLRRSQILQRVVDRYAETSPELFQFSLL